MNGNYNNGIPNGYDFGSSNPPTSLNDEVANGMKTYLKAKANFKLLTGDNQNLVSNLEYYMGLAKGPVKQLIDTTINNYYSNARATGQTEEVNKVAELKQNNYTRALVKQEEAPLSRRAAFINVAILIYGSLNIGFIIALALLK